MLFIIIGKSNDIETTQQSATTKTTAQNAQLCRLHSIKIYFGFAITKV